MLLLCALGALLQERVEVPGLRTAYHLSRPAAYTDQSSWPAILDLGDPADSAREPECLVVRPDAPGDAGAALACLADAKTRTRVDPERVFVRGGPPALALGVEHPELFAGCALRSATAPPPGKRLPPVTLFLARGEAKAAESLAAAMMMKKAGVDVELRETAREPGEVLAAFAPRIHPRRDLVRADELDRAGRTLDATLLLIDLAGRPDLEYGARTRLRSLEGKAIIELAKVEIAMSDRRYKDAILRCREAARQFAWLPQGERLRRRAAELESRPEVQKALETPD